MKVAIYCRLSEEDRNKQFETDDSNSIQNQKAMLLQYAMEQGWEVYNIYSDDDYTGSDRRRPEFNRLLADAEARRFNIVLCKTQSRFTRELELVEKYIHGLFPIWGIRFVSIVDNADTANKGNKKSRQINGLVNEWYLEDMSDNIRSVLTNRRQNGFHIGAFALYGYKKDPEQKGHLIIDEEAAAIVREVFTLFSQGYGKTAIARMLNDRGIPNPTEYKRLHGLRYQQPKRKNSTLWKYFAISDMLINEIFARKARCANCGYTMRSSKNRGKHYLQCSNRHVAKDACIGSFISVDKLEQMVIAELNRLAAEYLDKDELEQNIEFCDNLQGQKKRLLADMSAYEKKIAEYSKGIRELYMDKVKGLISESDFVELSKDFTTEKERLERVMIDGQKQLAEIEERIAVGDNRRELIEQYTNLEHLTREIVEILIDYIVIGKRIPGTKDVPIEIHWNF